MILYTIPILIAGLLELLLQLKAWVTYYHSFCKDNLLEQVSSISSSPTPNFFLTSSIKILLALSLIQPYNFFLRFLAPVEDTSLLHKQEVAIVLIAKAYFGTIFCTQTSCNRGAWFGLSREVSRFLER